MNQVILRDLATGDFEQALRLYQILTRDPVPVSTSSTAFDAILNHPGTHVVGVEDAGQVIAMVTLHLLPNMTSGGRPYALIENVICDPAHQGKGIGRAVLQGAIDRAKTAGAYKIMLMTGTARSALGFYEKLGFSGHEKHGLVLRF
ncbi:GNAT family N-acetyltransferase [uncultured Sulfitobacter sp.]|uniref:GNAT family N-acetyltransferase n=1 Tax=uncultured Sulfitobacter sp. TaxID=191468 RepID=UPI0026392B83|nr:GNAT family N-acetyltransferase [uncultured Sulfitobacter sp.]